METAALPPEAAIPEIPQSDPSLISLDPSEIDPRFASTTIDLVSAALGGRILSFSDQWFADAANLINPKAPIRRPGVFVESGAWYDGWETRRHNPNPPDSVTIRLAPSSGIPVGIEIDTAHFNGNHAEHISVLSTYAPSPDADTLVQQETYPGWTELLGKRKCEASRRHAWILPPRPQPPQPQSQSPPQQPEAAPDPRITHVKLLMHPDGGIARFRLHGHAVPLFPPLSSNIPTQQTELSASLNGGLAIASSNQHFGRAANILLPGRGVDMGDGWETARSRVPGHTDWVVVRLGARGRVRRCVVDTMHFRGNFPRSCGLLGYDAVGWMGAEVRGDEEEGWVGLGEVGECEADREHEVLVGEEGGVVCTHVKLVIVPDGGVKRLRVWGERV